MERGSSSGLTADLASSNKAAEAAPEKGKQNAKRTSIHRSRGGLRNQARVSRSLQYVLKPRQRTVAVAGI